MPSDRPHSFKGYTYYTVSEGKRASTDFGVFAYAYSGTPQTSIVDVGFAFPGAFPTLVAGNGKWMDVSQDPATGAITVGNPRTFRTAWLRQADFNVGQTLKFREAMNIKFYVNFTNLFNSRQITAYYPLMDSQFSSQYIAPGGLSLFAGAPAYAAYEHPYDVAALLNNSQSNTVSGAGPITVNSQYARPFLFQLSRNIRLGLKFTF